MKQYTQAIKSYFKTYHSNLLIGTSIIIGVVLLISAFILFTQDRTPKIVFQPAKACELLKPAEAKELLGDKTISSTAKNPVQSENVAVSSCGYTDGNPEINDMTVAAINIRSGINEEGVEQNKREFRQGMPNKNIESIKDLGERAYFNQENGQLNILDDRNWIILSYGVGSSPESNSLENAITLAKKII